ncbi:MAG: hypothetical protein IPO86_09995 [Saprospiraceae bacterium]|nr:hypothetical protein [Saprospiraceae bacterium]
MIQFINNEIQFYKNLSFKVINVDKEAFTRTDISVIGVTKYPWLRVFEEGKIIDNWNIDSLKEGNWDNWSKKWGVEYTLDELNELRKSSELQKIEAERKLLEEKLNEQKKILEQTNNAKKATDEASLGLNKNLIIGGAALVLLFIFLRK